MIQNERAGVDAVTMMMNSASYLAALTQRLASPELRLQSIGAFHDEFIAAGVSANFTPFHEGTIYAYLYLGILYTRENWRDVVPDKKLAFWSINPNRLVSRKKDFGLHYFVRRVRNSLGHGSFEMAIPPGTGLSELWTSVTITFTDVDPNNPRDKFEVELPLGQAIFLAKKLHEAAHKVASAKYGILDPSDFKGAFSLLPMG